MITTIKKGILFEEQYDSKYQKTYTYNKFLEYLLSDDPKKVLSATGTIARKTINPIARKVAGSKKKYKHVLIEESPTKKGRIIFAPTHHFKDDVLYTILSIQTQAYIMFGSLPQFFNTQDGIDAWINGAILIDRKNKESRKSSKEKAKRALSLSSNLIWYTEGVWNKTPNKLALKEYGGFYDVAKEYKDSVESEKNIIKRIKNKLTHGDKVYVCPIAHLLLGDTIYTLKGECYDPTLITGREEARELLREKQCTLMFNLLEKFSNFCEGKKLSFPSTEEEWQQYISEREAEVDFYDRDVEYTSEYVDKDEVNSDEVFAFMKTLQPSKENCFLFRKR